MNSLASGTALVLFAFDFARLSLGVEFLPLVDVEQRRVLPCLGLQAVVDQLGDRYLALSEALCMGVERCPGRDGSASGGGGAKARAS